MAQDDYSKLDDNYDTIPGSDRLSEEYARNYDDQNELEWTNLPENHHQIALARGEQRFATALKTAKALHEGEGKRVLEWPDVGAFIIPVENTFQSHLALVRHDTEKQLNFDPERYQFFDLIVAGISGRHDMFDPSHPDYPRYQTARENLAVLRNDIMGQFMDDHSFDPGDEKFIPNLVGIADEIGQMLANEKNPVARAYQPFLSSDMLNVEGDGAAYAYQHLINRQEKSGLFREALLDIKRVLGLKTREWYLHPVEQTAFSDVGLNAPPPADLLTMDENDIGAFISKEQQKDGRVTEQELEMRGVEVISQSEQQESVEHGITILRWLQQMQLADKGIGEVIEAGTAEEKEQLENVIPQTLEHYATFMSDAMALNPELRKMQAVRAAEQAAETLDHSVKLLAALEKPDSIADTQQISSGTSRQPERWDELRHHTVDRLVKTLKGGMEEAVNSLAQQLDDNHQARDEAVEAALTSLILATSGKKKKKKSGFGGRSQLETHLAHIADDASAEQGRHAQIRQGQKTIPDEPRKKTKVHGTSKGRNFEYEGHDEHAALHMGAPQSHETEGDDFNQLGRTQIDIDGDGIADRQGEKTSAQKLNEQMNNALDNVQQQQQQRQSNQSMLTAQQMAQQLAAGKQVPTEQKLPEALQQKAKTHGSSKGRNFEYEDREGKAVRHDITSLTKGSAATQKAEGKKVDIDGDGIADTPGGLSSLAQKDLDVVRALGKTLSDSSKTANTLPPAESKGKGADTSFTGRTENDRRDPNKNQIS